MQLNPNTLAALGNEKLASKARGVAFGPELTQNLTPRWRPIGQCVLDVNDIDGQPGERLPRRVSPLDVLWDVRVIRAGPVIPQIKWLGEARGVLIMYQLRRLGVVVP